MRVGIEPRANTHCMLWRAAAGSLVDLHPTAVSGITATSAYFAGGIRELTLARVRRSAIWDTLPWLFMPDVGIALRAQAIRAGATEHT